MNGEGKDSWVSLLALGPSALLKDRYIFLSVPHSFQMKYSTVSWYLAREGRALNCTVGEAVLQMPFPPSPKFNTLI